ncbi:tRNA modification GTPase trmE [Nonlabens sp. Hel1_33_55]|uniref:tRNA uridine-5-carboxymethylaminomethyl(34) synthesis GTPase MnmE n=1 Tax=Nonlabens sp. Hel1_33_55 TaxID=1336802 RepID=UPI000875BE9E|nr:tRNA uridine-5-carboxymethylaminomethyl(34) synthesis GTPase MnmE [Nonlabens sp. Hel1_33_55]SCY00727.1 tRNA modification GTPase trmE [Nonlabens sp. Hel1_33_55]
MFKNDTIVALATPAGSGAIAVIRLSGPDAHAIAGGVFVPAFAKAKSKPNAKLYERLHPNTVTLGHVLDGDRVVDQVLLTRFDGPRSYTGEDVVEFSCHGSIYIQQEIIGLCLRKGARAAKAGEFTLQAFLNAKMDLSQAEAVADLIASESETAHQMAIQQMRGGFSNELQDLRKQLLNFSSMIELELDFSEEDVEFANRDDLKKLLAESQKTLRKLIDSFALGNVLKSGIPIAIVGEPNVGKSTLLNALLNEDKAIVSDIAGTTRDSIEDEINIEGIRFRFIDTAGIRETTDTIETMGIQRSYSKAEQSRLVLYLLDATQLNTNPRIVHCLMRIQIMKEKFPDKPIVVVLNKLDEITGLEHAEITKQLTKRSPETIVISLSAKSGTGVEELKEALVASFQSGALSADDSIVSNARHYDALQKAYATLMEVQQGIENDISSEFLAIDIKATAEHIGLITGEITNDELLGNIFSQFCIGK